MRVGIAVPVEVHIARNKIESLIMALNGRGRRPAGAFVTRAVSVRLRAPQGGFWIEADLARDAMGGGFVVSARRRSCRLALDGPAQSARSQPPAADGLGPHRWTGRRADESAPPDRVIDIKVKSNKARRLGSLIVWLVVLSIGAALGYFGQDVLEAALPSIRHLIGN